MTGNENDAFAMGDYGDRNYYSNLMTKEFDAKSFPNGNESQEHKNYANVKREDVNLKTKVDNVNKRSLTERRAGFNVPTINTDQIRAVNYSCSNSDIQSPYFTVPAGLSPTTLLGSPVLLSNSQALPSPTTGTYSLAQNNIKFLSVLPNDCRAESINPDQSDAKPPLGSNQFSFSDGRNQPSLTTDPHKSMPCIETSLQNIRDINLPNTKPLNIDITSNRNLPNILTKAKSSSPPNYAQEDEKGELSQALGAPAEDGYNWRKYGQKHVKGSEYPRSYYKCTYTNCPVKKKVERNHEGQITEIIYKGVHPHEKPPPNRRLGVPSSHSFNEYQLDGHEVTPPGSGPTGFENQENGEVSSTLSNEDEEDRTTHGSASVGCDGEGEESESKRRMIEASAMDMSAASRAVREPRVVVQTTSEVDILDDGYRWRKYGQKVVKGNPNPRSYYKCTHPGCSVRKHVERASHDLKSVITTYEGKHNHEVPAARGSNNNNVGSSSNSSLHTNHIATSASQPPRGVPAQERFPNFSFGIGMGVTPNLTMPRFGPMAMPLPLPCIYGVMGHHNRFGGEAGFMVPKGEVKEENVTDPGLNMDIFNGASAAYYHQLMGRML